MGTASEILDDNGQIRTERIEDLLVEVATGLHLFHGTTPPHDLFASRPPTNREQEHARIKYVRALHAARQAGVRTKSEMEQRAIEDQQLDPNEQDEKKNLIKMGERLMKAREQTTDANQKIDIDAQMIEYRGRLTSIEIHEQEIYRHTAEALAESARTVFFMFTCTMTGDLLDEPLWPSWEEFQLCDDRVLIHDARVAQMRVSQGLPITIIRAIARTNEWRARWKSSKEANATLFEGVSAGWDANKLNLVYWSDFYDTIYKHPESPPEEVIRNDEKLQEWISSQVAKKNGPPPGTKMHTPRPVPTVKNGKGQRQPMVKVGEANYAINAPYKRRVSGI